MSSTIFYRFKSQNSNSRIIFDGTGLTVFDLKREIINKNKLAPATDFNLTLYDPYTNEEYTDDNAVIPKSSMVIARRSPALALTRQNASRYILGKPRVTRSAKYINSTNSTQTPAAATVTTKVSLDTVSDNADEEDKIKTMFQNQDTAWQETQELMDNATPVYLRKTNNNKDETPPAGYICFRCGGSNHYIKNCPTNGDVKYDSKRVKRVVGIPKSFLKTVNKEELDKDDGAKYMLNKEGEFVTAVADTKQWELHQKKRQQFDNFVNNLSVTNPELLDPLSKQLFNNPVKTPCCNKTYSLSSIEDLLISSDFVCPNCKATDILLDQLKPDLEMKAKIKAFLEGEAEKNGMKRSDINDGIEDEADSNNKRLKLPSKPILPVIPQTPQNSLPVPPPFMMPFMMPFMNMNNNTNGQ